MIYDDFKCGIPDNRDHLEGCATVGCHCANIGIPIEIKPDVMLGNICIECCGDPCVICKTEGCGTGYQVEIIGKIRMCIPVEFGITAEAGDEFIECIPEGD